MSGPRLSIIPAGAIFDRSLEPRDMHVLNLLGCYTDKQGWCRRSQVKMAKQLNCGRSSVQRSLDNLIKAGWVEKKRPPWSNAEGPPSNSYMYRVVLDRDDYVQDEEEEKDSISDESYADDAMDEADCPPMGTRVPADGHPGAHPCVGTPAQTYVGTKNDPLERPLIERERDARARARTIKFLAAFEQRWPTAAVDDRQRTAYAAEALAPDEQDAAIKGVGPFLDYLTKHRRKNVPAGWRYLEEKRWTLLEKPEAATPATASYPADSAEAKALIRIHDLAGTGSGFRKIWCGKDGLVRYRKSMTPRILAFAEAPPREDWPRAAHNQAASWRKFLEEASALPITRPISEGDPVPWPWPPSVEGKIYSDTTGPPQPFMTEEDYAHI
jgi:predicted transcriptional regulator